MTRELNFQLDNGLRVYIQECHTTPVVALQVWVGVGSADEHHGQEGIAHVLEHMMFKGTQRRSVGRVAQEVESAGGDINAYTSFDQTVYHITLAARHFDMGLDILSDVIQNSSIDSLELSLEKEVVLEEIRRGKDSPGRQLGQAVFKTVFARHTYGRPVIGFEESVKNFDRDAVHSFFKTWYTPENMVFVVVGDINADESKEKISNAFKDFKAQSHIAHLREIEPIQTSPRFVGIKQSVKEAQIQIAFPIPSASHKDTPLLDLLALILGQGQSSRLIEVVKNQKQLVNSVYSSAYTPKDDGIFFIGASFDSNRFMEVYEAILEQVSYILHNLVKSSELIKAKHNIQTGRVYEKETVDGRAKKFGYYLLNHNGLEEEKRYYHAIEEATPEDILRVARTYLVPSALNIGILFPEEKELPDENELLSVGVARLTLPTSIDINTVITRHESEVVKFELPNGIRLLVKENHAIPLVSIRAFMNGGLMYERSKNNGITHLVAQMFTKGTIHRTAFDIAHEIESLAGGLGGTSGRHSFGLRADFLSQNLDRGFELFSEILTEPSFNHNELEKLKRINIEAIKNQADHPSSYLFKLFHSNFFAKHPFKMSSIGTEESQRAISCNMLKKYHNKYITGPNLVLAVVGDVDPRDVESLVAKSLGTISPKAYDFHDIPLEHPITEIKEYWTENTKEQVHLLMGWRGVSINHPDKYAMAVLSSILSGQSGRLFYDLRDKQGLAYSVSSAMMESVDEGYFAIYMATEPNKYERAKAGILNEVNKLLQDGIRQDELDRAKRYIIGSFEIDLQRSSAICSSLAINELLGLGYMAHKTYPERIEHVTIDEVNNVAKKYLSTNSYVLTVLGPKTKT